MKVHVDSAYGSAAELCRIAFGLPHQLSALIRDGARSRWLNLYAVVIPNCSRPSLSGLNTVSGVGFLAFNHAMTFCSMGARPPYFLISLRCESVRMYLTSSALQSSNLLPVDANNPFKVLGANRLAA